MRHISNFYRLLMKYNHSWQFSAIGTTWCIETSTPIRSDLHELINQQIDQFDTAYSRFKANSLLRKATNTPGKYDLPPDAATLFELYSTLSRLTNGSMSPLVGLQLSAAGYDETYSLTPAGAVPKGLRENDYFTYSRPTLIVKQPCVLDFGAAGKGYLADLVAGVMTKYGLCDFAIDASGDIVRATSDDTLEVIGLENPFDDAQIIGTASLSSGALCASATQRRSWGDSWHHVIDVTTGKPVKNIVASWVVAETGILADGLATALFFAKPDVLEEVFSFEYVTVSSKGEINQSANFPGLLYS